MGLKLWFIEVCASLIIVLKRIAFLIFDPYKTMRSISKETDYIQPVIIFSSIFLYYISLVRVKDIAHSPLLQFAVVLINFIGTIFLVYIFTYIHKKKVALEPFIFLFSYTLIPTIIWFYMNTFLYVVIPPPRNITVLGKAFSIVFITLSTSLLVWKVILWYLAVRFSTRLQFYDILFIFFVYLAVIIPYSLVMYHAGFFRIPFI